MVVRYVYHVDDSQLHVLKYVNNTHIKLRCTSDSSRILILVCVHLAAGSAALQIDYMEYVISRM